MVWRFVVIVVCWAPVPALLLSGVLSLSCHIRYLISQVIAARAQSICHRSKIWVPKTTEPTILIRTYTNCVLQTMSASNDFVSNIGGAKGIVVLMKVQHAAKTPVAVRSESFRRLGGKNAKQAMTNCTGVSPSGPNEHPLEPSLT